MTPQYLILKSKEEKGVRQYFNYLNKFKSAL